MKVAIPPGGKHEKVSTGKIETEKDIKGLTPAKDLTSAGTEVAVPAEVRSRLAEYLASLRHNPKARVGLTPLTRGFEEMVIEYIENSLVYQSIKNNPQLQEIISFLRIGTEINLIICFSALNFFDDDKDALTFEEIEDLFYLVTYQLVFLIYHEKPNKSRLGLLVQSETARLRNIKTLEAATDFIEKQIIPQLLPRFALAQEKSSPKVLKIIADLTTNA